MLARAAGGQRRNGVIGVWVAVALTALLGMAALVIDLGRVSVAAQQVQAIVDAAALAGAAKLPAQSDAEASLQRTISANNAINQAWAVSCVPSNDVVYYTSGQTVPDYGALADDENAIKVTGRATVDYSFAKIFGINSATVVRSATAKAKAGGSAGSGLFFAGETKSYLYGITINGSHQYVDGGMHSNTKVLINGSHQTVIGDIEYLNSYIINGCGFSNDGKFVASAIKPYPLDFTWEQFDQGPWDYDVSSLTVNGSNKTVNPGRWRIRGNMTINGSGFHCDGCLFVVDGTVMVNGSNHILDNTTFVSKNTITFNGGVQRYSALVDNLFAFSTLSNYGWTAITMNGADQETWGMFYAPNAGLIYNGSGQEIHHGGLVAKTITINGSHGTFCGFGDGGSGGGPPEITLIK